MTQSLPRRLRKLVVSMLDRRYGSEASGRVDWEELRYERDGERYR